MASRFVSGGAIDASSGEAVAATSDSKSAPQSRAQERRLEEWEAVQRDLAAERRAREDARRAAGEMGGGEKSLYETLQANKAAKQAEFEEKSRIRNQFRGVDEDEVEWLEGVRDSARGEEERRRREIEEGLEAFRADAKKEREEAGQAEEEAETEDWAVSGKKRKRRDVKGGLKGIKRAATAGSTCEVSKPREEEAKTKPVESASPVAKETKAREQEREPEEKAAPQPSPSISKPKPKMGLVEYGSDDDDDD